MHHHLQAQLNVLYYTYLTYYSNHLYGPSPFIFTFSFNGSTFTDKRFAYTIQVKVPENPFTLNFPSFTFEAPKQRAKGSDPNASSSSTAVKCTVNSVAKAST